MTLLIYTLKSTLYTVQMVSKWSEGLLDIGGNADDDNVPIYKPNVSLHYGFNDVE